MTLPLVRKTTEYDLDRMYPTKASLVRDVVNRLNTQKPREVISDAVLEKTKASGLRGPVRPASVWQGSFVEVLHLNPRDGHSDQAEVVLAMYLRPEMNARP